MTNKPNPALLHLERQRIEETKRNDAKLKRKFVVKLRRAEKDFDVARKWVEENNKLNNLNATANSDAKAIVVDGGTDSTHKQKSDAIQNNKDITSQDKSAKRSAEDREKSIGDEVLENIDTSGGTTTLIDEKSEDNTNVNKANNKSSLSDNIIDMANPEGNEISADKDPRAANTADEEINKTVAPANIDSEITEAVEVIEFIETVDKTSEDPMGVLGIIESLEAALDMEPIVIHNETDKPVAMEVTDIIQSLTSEINAAKRTEDKAAPDMRNVETIHVAEDETVIEIHTAPEIEESDRVDTTADDEASQSMTYSVTLVVPTHKDTKTAETSDTSDKDADKTTAAKVTSKEIPTSRNNSIEITEQVTEDETASEIEESVVSPICPSQSQFPSSYKDRGTNNVDPETHSIIKSSSATSTRENNIDTSAQTIVPESYTNDVAI
ncbi:GH21483 [Drosophila grimshawi]|uniref:GH21483 n=2 Tax=Drosophila grimshawi TaxID=7222 RepID=B4J3U3_DROGR|nr:GH21483 [Drosophila grimshawi]